MLTKTAHGERDVEDIHKLIGGIFLTNSRPMPVQPVISPACARWPPADG
jgi:hypothetical protein